MIFKWESLLNYMHAVTPDIVPGSVRCVFDIDSRICGVVWELRKGAPIPSRPHKAGADATRG